MDAVATATSAMIAAVARFERVAGSAATPAADPTSAAIEAPQAQASLGANVAVLKAAERAMDSLLNVFV